MNKHIMAKEFSVIIGGAYNMPKVALFNDKKISEEKVDELIRTGMTEYCDDVVVISQKQYESLCGR